METTGAQAPENLLSTMNINPIVCVRTPLTDPHYWPYTNRSQPLTKRSGYQHVNGRNAWRSTMTMPLFFSARHFPYYGPLPCR